MNVNGHHYQTIWLKAGDERVVQIIDQRFLPHQFVIEELTSVARVAAAIREMHVRGAGLIGAAAGFGMYLAALEAAASSSFADHLSASAAQLRATRPTAINLAWAIERQLQRIGERRTAEEKITIGLATAREIAAEDAEYERLAREHYLTEHGQ